MTFDILRSMPLKMLSWEKKRKDYQILTGDEGSHGTSSKMKG